MTTNMATAFLKFLKFILFCIIVTILLTIFQHQVLEKEVTKQFHSNRFQKIVDDFKALRQKKYGLEERPKKSMLDFERLVEEYKQSDSKDFSVKLYQIEKEIGIKIEQREGNYSFVGSTLAEFQESIKSYGLVQRYF